MKAAQRKQLQLWQERIYDWQQTGLSQIEWCKQHQLTVHQLSYWKRKRRNAPDSKVMPLALLTPKTSNTEKLIPQTDNSSTQEQAIILITSLQASS